MRAALRQLGLALAFMFAAMPAFGQGTAEDYSRAESLRTRVFGLVAGVVDEPTFSDDSKTLVYRRTAKGGGYEFVQVDLVALTKTAAFDQPAIAKSLEGATGRPWKGGYLPFANYRLSADRASMEFEASNAKWLPASSSGTSTTAETAIPSSSAA